MRTSETINQVSCINIVRILYKLIIFHIVLDLFMLFDDVRTLVDLFKLVKTNYNLFILIKNKFELISEYYEQIAKVKFV